MVLLSYFMDHNPLINNSICSCSFHEQLWSRPKLYWFTGAANVKLRTIAKSWDFTGIISLFYREIFSHPAFILSLFNPFAVVIVSNRAVLVFTNAAQVKTAKCVRKTFSTIYLICSIYQPSEKIHGKYKNMRCAHRYEPHQPDW